jgi:hypothetical protein
MGFLLVGGCSPRLASRVVAVVCGGDALPASPQRTLATTRRKRNGSFQSVRIARIRAPVRQHASKHPLRQLRHDMRRGGCHRLLEGIDNSPLSSTA